jgi:hypothetical protein
MKGLRGLMKGILVAGTGILAAEPNGRGRANSRLSWLAQPQHSFVMVGATMTNEEDRGGGAEGILGAGTAARLL